MTDSRGKYLFQRYYTQTATDEEITEFMAWITREENEEKLKAFIDDAWAEFNSMENIAAPEESERMLHHILRKHELPETKSNKRNFKWFGIAAAILVIVVSGIYFLNIRKEKTKLAVNSLQAENIAPGGNKATLTLANGFTIALNNVQNGALARQGNTQIIKLNNGQLVYRALQKKKQSKVANEVLYNSVATPRSGQYRITLPDGSQVWLNASSSLKFPAAFNGKKRKVEVKGEAYFEVKKDASRPFIVQIFSPEGNELGTVKVLGTHFNVNAYLDGSSVKTTLVEGVIKIVKGAAQELLKPGEQAIMEEANDHIEVAKVNTDGIVAWKNGFFQFNGDGIAVIMHEIARWYDVEVSYKNHHIPQGHYTGIISRNTNLSEVLKILETGGFHFKVTGRKIIVN
jgi:ferric-dicitrate binding protein FerR (iron transport regulator)